MEVVSILLGLVSIAISYYFSTKRQRLKKKIAKLEAHHKTLGNYSSTTGYKTIIRDCFQTVCYVGGTLLLLHGTVMVFSIFFKGEGFQLFTKQFSAGIYLGLGIILLELFWTLGQLNKSDESKEKLKSKIESLQKEL